MHRFHFLRATAGVLLLALAGAGAQGATITVNTLSDAIAADGACSIREAVGNANGNAQTNADCAAGYGADSIVFDATVFATPQTITLNATLTLIDTQTTTIDGAGKVTLDGGNAIQIVVLINLAHAQLIRLTLAHGACIGTDCNGGAIYNFGDLALTDCTVTASHADGSGGGIFSGAPLSITRSRVTGNSAPNGGGIFSQTYGLSLIASTVSGNTSTNGAGLYILSASATLTDTTVSGNSLTSVVAYGAAGGIRVVAGSLLTLTNSTVSGNHVAGTAFKQVGGISSMGTGPSLVLIGSTVTANDDYDVLTPDTGNQSNPTRSIGSIMTNVLLGSLSADSHDNLIGNVANLNLGPLQGNGGVTQTLLPGPGSVAIDAVGCADLSATDQRGVLRPQGAQCDIGAVEVERDLIFANGFELVSQCSGATATNPVWLDEFNGGSLNAALWNANANGGSLAVASGSVTASSSGAQFPFVTAISPIPGSGPFSVRWKATYSNVVVNGVGTLVLSNGLPANGANDDYTLRRADAWQDSTNGFQVRARTSDAGSYSPVFTTGASATTAHDVEVCWLANTVEIWADGVLRSSASNASLTRPNALWFGNPVVRVVGANPWTSFALDFVRVSALTTN